jgi:recombinational DNA repair protein (RecF pathway)
VTCGQCGRTLPANGASPDFCDEVCQRQWHTTQSGTVPIGPPRWENWQPINLAARTWGWRRAA